MPMLQSLSTLRPSEVRVSLYSKYSLVPGKCLICQCGDIHLCLRWATVMQTVVKKTYQVWYCLFISFRILVCIFFSQLIVGILIGQFQENERDRHSVVGEVRLALNETTSLLTERQQAELQSRLATVARDLISKDQDPDAPSRQSYESLSVTKQQEDLSAEVELAGVFGDVS